MVDRGCVWKAQFWPAALKGLDVLALSMTGSVIRSSHLLKPSSCILISRTQLLEQFCVLTGSSYISTGSSRWSTSSSCLLTSSSCQGKTLAYLLPMLPMFDGRVGIKNSPPVGLVLAPTRELVVQVNTAAPKP